MVGSEDVAGHARTDAGLLGRAFVCVHLSDLGSDQILCAGLQPHCTLGWALLASAVACGGSSCAAYDKKYAGLALSKQTKTQDKVKASG